MKNFIILCRYEHWAKNGKTWCKWYVVDSTPKTREQALKKIESLKTSSQQTAKITKLKYEFKAVPVRI